MYRESLLIIKATTDIFWCLTNEQTVYYRFIVCDMCDRGSFIIPRLPSFSHKWCLYYRTDLASELFYNVLREKEIVYFFLIENEDSDKLLIREKRFYKIYI